ncbi:hypothetical protein [Bacillus sp. 165]|uniref:hypothetical protein n=1 Tax=Bacillus sp. 165 TaxID=1529117 RepID=UPI001AD9DC20|nr:hypothetical protein [Bacillus sp. 165]MBO9128556.1 hypothetical protein [Bacillus sp. 165]
MGNTTSMLIEHIINGFHFLLVLILFILTLTGLDFVEPLYNFLDNSNKDGLLAIFILFLPFVYTLGLIMDNFVDDVIFKRKEQQIKSSILKDSESARKLILLSGDDNQGRQLDYIRTKIRITRSTTVSFALITFLSLVFTATRLAPPVLQQEHLSLLLCVELLIGPSLTLLGYWSWKKNTETFCRRVANGFAILEQRNEYNNKTTVGK